MKIFEKILLALFIILDTSHIIFYNSDLRYDIYLFYDYKGGRYLCNIIYDLAVFFGFAALFYILWQRVSKIYLAFFIWWLFNIIGYFLFYAQMINLIGLPLLLFMVLWIKKKN